MTTRQCITAALISALPIEAGNLLLVGMVLDPGPLPAGLLPRLLAGEWVFFHFIGFRMIDVVHKLLGTEKAGLAVAFLLAYFQTALLILLVLRVATYFRARANSRSRAVLAH